MKRRLEMPPVAPAHRMPRFSRGRVVAALVLTAASLPFLVNSAGAVHDAGALELDTGANGADLVDSVPGSDPRDWAGVFTGPDGAVGTTPAGTIDTAFARDFVPGSTGPDGSYYLPSSKDDQPINAAGGSSVWGCTEAANPTDKNEILNAYALAVTAQSGVDAGDQIIYTGGERYANNGTAFFGVWFFQADTSCNSTGSAEKFAGAKTDGDVLLLVNFDQGGSNIAIDAFTWHPCDAAGSPIPASKCKDATLNAGFFTPTLSGSVGGDCASAGAGDNVCATVNRAAVTTPWLSEDKTSPDNTLAVSEFFETGFNVTDAFNLTPGQEPCFSSFLLETRSSDSLDATLKDFAGGQFSTCGSVTAHKYHDKNANKIEDAGEPGLAGWTLFIDKDGSGTLTAGDVSKTTDANGNVTFSDIKGGSVSVCESLTSGWINSDPGAGTPADPDGTTLCKTVAVNVDQTSTVKFGNYQPGAVRGTKFQDNNANGAKDTGESGMAGIEIHLFGTNGYGQAIHLHTTTAADGSYSFTNLIPGSYTICETVPTGYTQTYPTSGPACSTHDGPPGGDASGFGWTVVVGSGDNKLDNNFGNVAQHKTIVLVCHEGTNALVKSSVTIDGQTKSSLGTSDAHPSQGGTTITDATLCSIGGASFGGKLHQTYTGSVAIPSSGTGSGH